MRALGTGIAVALVGTAALSTLFTTTAPAASAQTGGSGTLGAGGVAKGDISLDAGDEDRISVDLVEGSTVKLVFKSAFPADVTLTDPQGTPVDPGWGTGNTRTAKAFAPTATGTWEFRIRATSSQGTYSLSAAAKFQKKVALPGTSGGTITWAMPANTSVSGKVAAVPARSWDSVLQSLVCPTGDLLPAPVAGAKGVVKLPKISSPAAGMHTLTVDGGTAGGAFKASLVLGLPKVKKASLNLTNGLTGVSYATGGVKDLLVARCGACHTWTASGTQAKSHAKPALARVKSGNMPQGGQRLSAAEIDLLASWISTGMKP